jgi:hypothetical protein
LVFDVSISHWVVVDVERPLLKILATMPTTALLEGVAGFV